MAAAVDDLVVLGAFLAIVLIPFRAGVFRAMVLPPCFARRIIVRAMLGVGY